MSGSNYTERYLKMVIKSATISETAAGRFYISILVEYENDIKPVTPKAEKVLGLDYSSKALYVDSEMNTPDYPKFYRQAEEKLKKEQRKLSGRKKGGRNREKQRLKVARLHERTATSTKHCCHMQKICPKYISVVIQVNKGWICLRFTLSSCFDRVAEVHHQIDGTGLKHSLSRIGYHVYYEEYPLSNGKLF